MKNIAVENLEELSDYIKTHTPTLYTSSKTSTVITYDFLEKTLGDEEKHLTLCDLSRLPKSIDVHDNNTVTISGSVNWKEMREELISKGKNIMTAPTEDLALVLAGVATSCTGERCFGFGSLRSQISHVEYMNYQGELVSLSADKDLLLTSSHHDTYKESYQKYRNLKNAPFPRLEKEIDLMVGTEGQLGVVTKATLKIIDLETPTHLFVKLPKWEDDFSAHMEIANKIQSWREHVVLCELVDSNSFSYLPIEERPVDGHDAIFFEVKADSFEKFYEDFISTLEKVNENDIFELSENKFHHIRASVPRAVFEHNSKMQVKKMGTDVQVELNHFESLLNVYKDFSKQGVKYNLFGHFGDCHLHFNFMPTKQETQVCQKHFEKLYEEVLGFDGSPFAEHGIGLIKQSYIRPFYKQVHFQIFSELKKSHDPYNQFFPQGFMNLKE